MKPFHSILNASELVPVPLLAAAQERQSKYSGSLGTNLLELHAIHARTLDELLAQHRNLPAVTLAGLMTQERPAGNLPSSLHKDPMFAPLAVVRGELWVVVHPDIPESLLERVSSQFPDLHFAITAECCFSQIWSQAYGTKSSARFSALADEYIIQLQSHPPGERYPAPVTRPAARGPNPSTAGPAQARSLPVALMADPPDDWDAIESALRRAEDRDVVTYLLQRAAQQLSPRVALFRIRDGELVGMPGPRCELQADKLRIHLSKSFAHALVHPRSIRRCMDLDLRLAVGLEQAVPCICAPVGLRGRPVLLLYLDRNGKSFRPEEIHEIHNLCSLAASQLLVHLRRTSRPSELIREDPSTFTVKKGDTHPELPVLSPVEQHPAFWSANAKIPFDTWSSDKKAAWENALATEDIDYFQQSPAESIEELAARLPGPQDSGEELVPSTLHSASASGRVPRMLVTLGDRSVEPVLRQIHRDEVSVRFVCALLFQELRSDRALDPLATLCFDTDPEVRRIAARVLETYRERPAYPAACHQVRDCLTHPDPNQQRYAIQALGILRDQECIPSMIEALNHKNPAHGDAALASLCSISGQQFGTHKDAWANWYKKHQDQPREQWLAASLFHKDVQVRAWAHDELVRLTGFDSQFDAHAPRSQRNAAIERWHRWWKAHTQSSRSQTNSSGVHGESAPA